MFKPGQLREESRRQREFALRLLKQAIGDDQTTETLALATDGIFGQLYNHLVVLIGAIGFEALVTRSIFLAKRECPFLGAVTTVVQGESFKVVGLETSVAGREFGEACDGLTMLLGTFFWLLVGFVGQNLFWQLMRGVWPDLGPEETGFSNEEKQ